MGNLVTYWTHPGPFALHFAISVLAIHLAFTIWHDAAHMSVSPTRWVNNVVGILGMLPYKTPFFAQKFIHMQHHRFMNEERDPNFIYTDGSFLTIPFRYLRAIRYAGSVLKEDPRTPAAKVSDTLSTAVVIGLYAAAFWFGVGFDLIALWLLPLVGAKLIMDWYINYIPHVGLPPNRYAGTRVLDVWWLTPLILGHNYHAVHHLWPDIPWYRYYRTFREKIDYLRGHGVPIQHNVFGPRSLPAKVEH